MFRQEDIIHNVPITEYYQLTPTEQNIYVSQLQSGKEYILTVQIQNLTRHFLAWRLRTRKRCLLNYKPEKKASCIPPYQAFKCVIVISLNGSITKESLVEGKPDKFQIMGTVLGKEQEGDELEATLAERFKLHNKGHNSYVYQETTHRCHLLVDDPSEPSVSRVRAASEGNLSGFPKYFVEQPSRLTLPQESTLFTHPSVSQYGIGAGAGGVVFVAAGELCNLRQKAKQHDELIKQITKIMKERDEAQLKLSEQVTENTIVWQRFSKLKEELRKSKCAESGDEPKTTDDFSRMFFEDFPSGEQLPDFKQPTAISLSMTLALTLFSSVFYITGRYFGVSNC